MFRSDRVPKSVQSNFSQSLLSRDVLRLSPFVLLRIWFSSRRKLISRKDVENRSKKTPGDRERFRHRSTSIPLTRNRKPRSGWGTKERRGGNRREERNRANLRMCTRHTAASSKICLRDDLLSIFKKWILSTIGKNRPLWHFVQDSYSRLKVQSKRKVENFDTTRYQDEKSAYVYKSRKNQEAINNMQSFLEIKMTRLRISRNVIWQLGAWRNPSVINPAKNAGYIGINDLSYVSLMSFRARAQLSENFR